MTRISVRKVAILSAFALTSFAMAQDATTANTTGGWHRVGDAQSATAGNSQDTQMSQSSSGAPTASPNTYPEPSQQQQAQPQVGTSQNAPQPMQQTYPNSPQAQQNPQYPQQQQYPMQRAPMQQGGNYAQVPAQVTVPAGTYLTVHINQRLSSDHNQVGDAFSATLARPLVANGVVIAEPGETIAGRVSQVEKSGRVEGLAKLGVELTDLTLVDGQQLPVKTMFISRTANSTAGRDAGAIAGTTALGAAIGAAAGWGRGAAIGAGAGAAVGIIGVLATRGEPSVIYPEQTLTFRLEQPLQISTSQSPQAFRYVQPNEYSNQMAYGSAPQTPAYGVPPAPYYYGGYPAYGYPYYGYPYYPYGGFSVFVGRGFYGRGYYGGRFYGRR